MMTLLEKPAGSIRELSEYLDLTVYRTVTDGPNGTPMNVWVDGLLSWQCDWVPSGTPPGVEPLEELDGEAIRQMLSTGQLCESRLAVEDHVARLLGEINRVLKDRSRPDGELWRRTAWLMAYLQPGLRDCHRMIDTPHIPLPAERTPEESPPLLGRQPVFSLADGEKLFQMVAVGWFGDGKVDAWHVGWVEYRDRGLDDPEPDLERFFVRLVDVVDHAYYLELDRVVACHMGVIMDLAERLRMILNKFRAGGPFYDDDWNRYVSFSSALTDLYRQYEEIS